MILQCTMHSTHDTSLGRPVTCTYMNETKMPRDAALQKDDTEQPFQLLIGCKTHSNLTLWQSLSHMNMHNTAGPMHIISIHWNTTSLPPVLEFKFHTNARPSPSDWVITEPFSHNTYRLRTERSMRPHNTSCMLSIHYTMHTQCSAAICCVFLSTITGPNMTLMILTYAHADAQDHPLQCRTWFILSKKTQNGLLLSTYATDWTRDAQTVM